MEWVQRWSEGVIDSVAHTLNATDFFNAEMREVMPKTVWATGCTSWYLGKDGLPELWPWTPDRHRERLVAATDWDDYEVAVTTL